MVVDNTIRSAGLFRWSYWSTGVVIGVLLMACSLPEVFYGWKDPPAELGLPVAEGLVSDPVEFMSILKICQFRTDSFVVLWW